jgi:hypothetical protein
MANRGSQHVRSAKRKGTVPKLASRDHHVLPSTPVASQPIPIASVERAQKAFGNFSVSKFATKALPPNHVGNRKDRSAVHAVQRAIIVQHINQLNDSDSPNQGMTIALPAKTMQKLLPSYDEESRTIELGNLLSVMTKRMSGTEFYCKGNPTLNRLALQSKVDKIVQAVKGEAKK